MGAGLTHRFLAAAIATVTKVFNSHKQPFCDQPITVTLICSIKSSKQAYLKLTMFHMLYGKFLQYFGDNFQTLKQGYRKKITGPATS